MSIISVLVLTLVGTWVFAKPHGDAPPSEVTGEDQSLQIQGDSTVLDNTVITEPEAQGKTFDQYIYKFNREGYYHAYRQNIYVYLGGVMGLVDSTDSDRLLNYTAGFLWELPKPLSPKWEVGAAWTTMSLGHVNVARKHIFNEKGSFRPFYRYGATLKIVPDEQGANLSNTDNYLLRVGIGLEDIMKPPRSVRIDMDLVLGAEDVWVIFQYGYSWGW